MSLLCDALEGFIKNRDLQRDEKLGIYFQGQVGLKEIIVKQLYRFLELHGEDLLFPLHGEFLVLF